MYFNYVLSQNLFTFFLGLLAVAVYFSFLVFVLANMVVALISLLIIFVCTAVVLILLDAEFLGLVFLIVYAGAIAILFLFVIMLLDLSKLLNSRYTWLQSFGIVLAGLFSVDFLFGQYLSLLNLFLVDARHLLTLSVFALDSRLLGSGTLAVLGQLLYTNFSIYLVTLALLLLVVLVGVVALLRTSLRIFLVVDRSVKLENIQWTEKVRILVTDFTAYGTKV